MRAVRSQAPRDRRARSDAPYQPDKMRIAGVARSVNVDHQARFIQFRGKTTSFGRKLGLFV